MEMELYSVNGMFATAMKALQVDRAPLGSNYLKQAVLLEYSCKICALL